MTSVAARIQSHPARLSRRAALLHHLSPLVKVEVVEHSSDPPNPWEGYKRCLADPPDTTHLLIVQDDVLPVPNFAGAVQRIAVANPDVPVILWMSAIPSNAAARARRVYGKQRYVPLGPAPFVPLVAVLWPRHVASLVSGWAERTPRLTRADDGNVARWMRQVGQQFLVTVPSICEHDDFTPSVKGGTRKESKGQARDRVALLLADDALDYDWTTSGQRALLRGKH